METLILYLSEYFEQTVSFLWLPLLIWTGISAIAWIVLKNFDNIHPQYQYHTRLALLISLPAGFLFLAGLQGLESYMLSQQASETSLRIISVMAPMEMSITPAETESAITFLQAAYAGIVLLFINGVIFCIGKFLVQWSRLHQLRKNCGFTDIQQIENLDQKNRQLISSIKKDVKITFLNADIIPVTFGYRNPIILLPASIRSHDENMNMALRHELSHITQNDFLSQMMAAFTQALFWYHPLVHRLKREIIEYRELRCDMLVLAEETISRKKYASLLLELLPKPNLQQELSVNMAQESSNLKKRITMITQQTNTKPIPKRTSLTLLGAIFFSTVIVMACTDMQTQSVFDEEELNLMTDIDRTGDRGFHQVVIFMSEEEQAERHESKLAQLRMLQPEHIQSINILKGEAAVEKYGSRGEMGVILINTKLSEESYNMTLKALGMETQTLLMDINREQTADEDFFVVVEDMPELIGGLTSIQREIRYPEMARRAGIEGRVFIQFIVNEQGDVENPRVIRGIGGGADEEALRVVRQAKFTPGMQRGRPVRVQYSIPISFRLQGSETTPEQSNIEPRDNQLNEMTVTGYGGNNQSGTQVEPENSVQRNLGIRLWNTDNGVRGTVMDARTNEPVVGANVVVKGTNIGSATDMEGNFTINRDNLDIESSVLQVSYIGYRTLETRVQE